MKQKFVVRNSVGCALCLISAILLLLLSCRSALEQEYLEHKPRANNPWLKVVPALAVKRPLIGLFVDSKSVASGPDGKTWGTAFRTLNEAIASSDGENIYVAAGTYKSPNIIVKDRENLRLYGGYQSGDLYEKDDFTTADEDLVFLDGELKNVPLVQISGKAKGIGFLGGFVFQNVRGASAFVILGKKNAPVTDVRIIASRFLNNDNTVGDGGGIKIEYAEDIRLDEVDAENNKAKFGGFIDLKSANRININNGTWQKNVANIWGGALCVRNVHRMIVSGITFYDNRARKGAGIYNLYVNNSEIKDINFTENIAEVSGGGLSLIESENISLSRISFSKNQVSDVKSEGGALTVVEGTNIALRLDNNEVTNNKAGRGGAFFFDDVKGLFLSGGKFVKNESLNNSELNGGGGTIYITSVVDLVMENNVIHDSNSAATAGAILIRKPSKKVLLQNILVANSRAAGFGGGLHLAKVGSSTSVTIANSTFENNFAKLNGGAIFTQELGQKLTINNTLFKNNQVDNYGGALALDAISNEKTKYVIGEGTRFFDNYAKQEDGGGAILVVFDDFLADDKTKATPNPTDRNLVFFNSVSDMKNNRAGNGSSNGQIIRITNYEIDDAADTSPPHNNGAPVFRTPRPGINPPISKLNYFIAYTDDPDFRAPWDRLKFDWDNVGSTTVYAW